MILRVSSKFGNVIAKELEAVDLLAVEPDIEPTEDVQPMADEEN